MRYCFGLLKSVPMLAQLIEAETRESVSLRNRIVIEVHTASLPSTRGYTIIAALLDEIAYWPTDEASAEPDVEVINAIKPGMATIPGAMLLCASVTARSQGRSLERVREALRQGQRSGAGVAGGDPRHERDGAADLHRRPHGGRPSTCQLPNIWRSSDPISKPTCQREVVEACIGDYYELSPEAGRVATTHSSIRRAAAAATSFALAIGHREGNGVVVDLVRERRPPFMPSQVIDEFIPLLKSLPHRQGDG